MDHLNESDLVGVYKSVFRARARWYNIGLNLNIPSSDLEIHKELSPNEALREVLKTWLRQTNPVPTWSRLIEALRSPTVGEYQLAQELERAPEQRGMLQGK